MLSNGPYQLLISQQEICHCPGPVRQVLMIELLDTAGSPAAQRRQHWEVHIDRLGETPRDVGEILWNEAKADPLDLLGLAHAGDGVEQRFIEIG